MTAIIGKRITDELNFRICPHWFAPPCTCLAVPRSWWRARRPGSPTMLLCTSLPLCSRPSAKIPRSICGRRRPRKDIVQLNEFEVRSRMCADFDLKSPAVGFARVAARSGHLPNAPQSMPIANARSLAANATRRDLSARIVRPLAPHRSDFWRFVVVRVRSIYKRPKKRATPQEGFADAAAF